MCLKLCLKVWLVHVNNKMIGEEKDRELMENTCHVLYGLDTSLGLFVKRI